MTWARGTTWLERHLPDGPHREERIHWLTLPVASWVLHHLRAAPRRPLMVGLNAPQGAGKTTLTKSLVGLFAELGVRAVSVSIDDFYLRRGEQLALASRHPDHPFLEHRGYPGTHDVELGARVLQALGEGRDVDVPRYDKSADGGRGDRSDEVTPIRGQVDVVLLEGWMLGFQPIEHVVDERLRAPNEALRAYAAWNERLDVLISLRMKDSAQVVRWRIEAEQAMRASGKPGLTDAEVEDYVRRFLPAYETWGDTLANGRWRAEQVLTLTLDEHRVPVRP
jgi:D-glycerate 3-kinase